ncbi:hypothetical protein HAX54_034117, partial [Datura stramonium]|nr:hypothetical protein [Datura stramonium]
AHAVKCGTGCRLIGWSVTLFNLFQTQYTLKLQQESLKSVGWSTIGSQSTVKNTMVEVPPQPIEQPSQADSQVRKTVAIESINQLIKKTEHGSIMINE